MSLEHSLIRIADGYRMKPRTPPFQSCLRSSLLGEYVAMAGLIYSSAGATCWMISASDRPIGFLAAGSLVWIFIRCTGALAGLLWTPCLSACLLALTGLIHFRVELISNFAWLQIGPLSVFAIMISLGFLLLIDLVDVAGFRSHHNQPTHSTNASRNTHS